MNRSSGIQKPVVAQSSRHGGLRFRNALLLTVLAALPAIGPAGCSPSAELAIYREGLRAVDEPLYEAHLQLMEEAVGAGLRSEADRETIKAGIKAARLLCEESRKATK